MACIYNGKPCIMVWHIKREKWVYIPLKKWYRMNDKQRNKYTDW